MNPWTLKMLTEVSPELLLRAGKKANALSLDLGAYKTGREMPKLKRWALALKKAKQAAALSREGLNRRRLAQ